MDDKAKLAMVQVTPARKYKQGKRVLRREIEMGIQPRILGFLSDVDRRGSLPGGQDGLGGRGGGGCPTSTSGERSSSDFKIESCSNSQKKRRKM